MSENTSYEYSCKIWTSEPDGFILNPIHQMSGLNTQALDPSVWLRSPRDLDSRSQTRGGVMSNLFWLNDEQMARLRPYFPKSHGKPRVDDRRVLSGSIFINRNGLRWSDAPKEYGLPKTLYNRWKRWSDMGVFARIMVGWLRRGQIKRRS